MANGNAHIYHMRVLPSIPIFLIESSRNLRSSVLKYVEFSVNGGLSLLWQNKLVCCFLVVNLP